MFNVCPACGRYSVEKQVVAPGPVAMCPFCGYGHPFRRLPLFVVTGASGAGKSTIALWLVERLAECVVLECDILWGPAYDTPADDYSLWRDTWLRLAKNVGQNGRPVVLCGTFQPGKLEERPERRYLAAIHYLALVPDDAVLVDRLRARPDWRASGSEPFVDRMLRFNQWLRASEAVTCLDNSGLDADRCADEVAAWVRAHLP